MQYGFFVQRINMVKMPIPIAAFYVYFSKTQPAPAIEFYFDSFEIGTIAVSAFSRIDNPAP
jgi:hypothetical protein